MCGRKAIQYLVYCRLVGWFANSVDRNALLPSPLGKKWVQCRPQVVQFQRNIVFFVSYENVSLWNLLKNNVFQQIENDRKAVHIGNYFGRVNNWIFDNVIDHFIDVSFEFFPVFLWASWNLGKLKIVLRRLRIVERAFTGESERKKC